jgi:hypothetical protein
MNDPFLNDARRTPRPEFAAGLRERLEREAPVIEQRRGWQRGPLMRAAAGVAAVAAVVLLFTLPSVRASAQAFLDLFRVRNFAAVSVDRARLEQLNSGAIDIKGLLGNNVRTIQEPGPPRRFDDPAAAGAAAGFSVRTPSVLPQGLQVDTVLAMGEGRAELTIDAAKLREVIASLGITDLTVPDNLDGAKATLHMQPGVAIHFRSGSGDAHAELLQARTPEVGLPPGIDLPRLGELGLRIAGLTPSEAHRFAQSIDWHSTVLVPVPGNATSFREVTVHGQKALLITSTGEEPNPRGRRGRQSMLLWSEGDMVYALHGSLDALSLAEMANSIH